MENRCPRCRSTLTFDLICEACQKQWKKSDLPFDQPTLSDKSKGSKIIRYYQKDVEEFLLNVFEQVDMKEYQGLIGWKRVREIIYKCAGANFRFIEDK